MAEPSIWYLGEATPPPRFPPALHLVEYDLNTKKSDRVLATHCKFADGERRHLHARERIVVFVADTNYILNNVEIVSGQRNTVDGVLNHAIFAPEAMGPYTEFTTHGSTARAAFEAHHQETLGEKL